MIDADQDFSGTGTCSVLEDNGKTEEGGYRVTSNDLINNYISII